MCDSELDQILEYLSVKLNRIFYDREFVGIVKEDLEILRSNIVNKPCVLVFPILGHIFLKAVRYQAKILNLAVFYIGSGHKRALAVCLRDYILDKVPSTASNEAPGKMDVESIKEPSVVSNTKKKAPRPAQQLYVPPAQRHRHINADKKTKKNDSRPKVTKENEKPGECKSRKSLPPDTNSNGTKIVPVEESRRFEDENSSSQVQCNDKCDIIKEETCDCGESASTTKTLECGLERLATSTECIRISDDDSSYLDQNERTSNTKLTNTETTAIKFPKQEDTTFRSAAESEGSQKDPSDKKDTNGNAKCELIIEARKLEDEVDKEKAEMRRATEKINRKSRSIIKYIDNSDTLKIEVDARMSGKKVVPPNTENLTNWEDMFDDEGELKEPYLDEIVKHVGNEVTIIKTSEDYSPYQNKALQDLDHVIELYDFPASFKTHDIIQLYSEVKSETMYVKWVDDTHALLVFSTPVQAQRALQVECDLVKSRPLCEASGLSQSVAFKHDLKPAMKRPQTSLQTARRMISTHLGTKTALSKEVMEKERKLLRDAREQRRLERQNEKDAWDGNPRPSTA